MTCNFESEVDVDFKFDCLKYYEAAVECALDVERCPYEAVVELLLTDGDSMRTINKSERGIDSETDVLSFPANDFAAPADFSNIEEDPCAFEPETGELILGDIVLSKDRIISQAYEYGHSIEREFTFLIVHSLLHLMGYDHMEDDERIVMEARQKIIMEKLSESFETLKVE